MTIEEQIALLDNLARLCAELDLDFTSKATANAARKLQRICEELAFNVRQRELFERAH